ncbi:acyloxyacyl hydrolase [Saccharicrinis sp. FJH54]|uniref:acyloxyacyl hydrolase n=1 Tax=Saccharicrinis sp. FJH54 TaxID=3344665 RepID=UPI0035D4DD5F
MKIIYTLFFLFCVVVAMAQTDSTQIKKHNFLNYSSLQFMYQNGHVFATNDFFRGTNTEAEKITAYQAFAIKLATQTTGDKLWQQIFNYPYWGAGIYTADFYNPEEIGNPIAIYGFFNAPFHRWENLTFNYEIGFGATFNWKSFNPVTNQYNVAIGAGESFLLDAGMNLEYYLTDKIALNAGFSLTHFSNGGMKKPNFGLNTIAPRVSLKYDLHEKPEFIHREVPDFSPESEWLISFYGGAKNVVFDNVDIDILEKYEGVFFPEFGFSLDYNRRISYKSKIGAGMSFSYDGSIASQVAVNNNELEAVDGPFTDKLMISIYPSYELVANRISLVLQPSFYLYRKHIDTLTPVFHQKVGLKYYLTDKVFAGIKLRAYKFHVSDFVEWNIGYRFYRK